mmetsp:Transcript_30193/g.86490  ORF Transcript_30193/g.86490 Transcript_30193/m.86490 type:complete len:631 (+) Transcript_30193:106-1998(+)
MAAPLEDVADGPETSQNSQKSMFSAFSSERERCPCGNVFMPDAVFCRKCGRRRDDAEDSQTGGAPIWSWSRDRVAGGWGRDKSKTFRFLDRESPMGQSLGKWNIARVASTGASAKQLKKLYMKDVYHTFIDGSSTFAQFLVYSLMYVGLFLFFAIFYVVISEACGLGIDGKFIRAYYLSLETVVTIGYGAPDPFYDNCWQGTVLMTVQSIVAYFLNALVIGSVFLRLTRPQSRANTILFSEKACIQEVNGALYFVFQVCEAKNHDLVQAHIRCYCIRHDRNGDQAYQQVPLRLQQPDDEHGSTLLLTFPTKIVHRIDNWSPLSPAADSIRRTRKGAVGEQCTPKDAQSSAWAYHWPEVPQRQVDAEQGNRDTCVCAVCGSSFQSFELLRRHTEYNAAQDPLNGVPEERCHKAWSAEEMQSWGWSLVEQRPRPGAPPDLPLFAVASVEPTREDIEAFISERFVEVVVLVEGIEPTTSATLQARHSYLFPDDIVWDRDFAKCALPGQTGEMCAIDMSRFNDLVPFSDNLDLDPQASPQAAPDASPKSPSMAGGSSAGAKQKARLVDIVSLGSEAVQQVQDAGSRLSTNAFEPTDSLGQPAGAEVHVGSSALDEAKSPSVSEDGIGPTRRHRC